MVHKSWRSPVEVGSLFSLSNVLHIPQGCLGFQSTGGMFQPTMGSIESIRLGVPTMVIQVSSSCLSVLGGLILGC